VAAEFDREWNLVLEEARREQDLEPVKDLLAKWRHFAYAELTAPGTYFRLVATTAQTLATGRPPAGSVDGAQMNELIRRRLGR